MKNDDIRKVLQADIDYFRSKAQYYNSIRLFEAEKYANSLSSNIELALTTMPSDSNQRIV